MSSCQTCRGRSTRKKPGRLLRSSGGTAGSASAHGPTPKAAELLEQAEDGLLAFYAFPAAHWSKLRSTNPLERVNREIGRRTDVVGIFPNDQALAGMVGVASVDAVRWPEARRCKGRRRCAAIVGLRLHAARSGARRRRLRTRGENAAESSSCVSYFPQATDTLAGSFGVRKASRRRSGRGKTDARC
jgi:Transposase, Mutator family